MVLAKEQVRHPRARAVADKDAAFVPFTAQTRMSGINLDGREIRKGAADAIAAYVQAAAARVPAGATDASSNASPARAARRWSSPNATRALGVVHLKDIVKGGMRAAIRCRCAPWASRRS